MKLPGRGVHIFALLPTLFSSNCGTSIRYPVWQLALEADPGGCLVVPFPNSNSQLCQLCPSSTRAVAKQAMRSMVIGAAVIHNTRISY